MFVVLGCGSIAKRHIGNLIALGVRDIVAFDPRRDRRSEVSNEFGITTTEREDGLLEGAEAVFICSPPSLHVAQALEGARNACALFIEKPLANTLEGLRELIASVRDHGLVGLVACNYRFHPTMAAAKEMIDGGRIGQILAVRADYGRYLPDWHPWEDYRKTYSASRALGGGVILDRIHELDYVRWLMGPIKRVLCSSGHLSALEIDAEDIADISLEVQSGKTATVHLDYLRRSPVCSCEVIGETGELRLDLNAGELRISESGQLRVAATWPDLDGNEMYLEELRHFLRCLTGEEQPSQDIHAGAEILAVALAARTSAATGQAVDLTELATA